MTTRVLRAATFLLVLDASMASAQDTVIRTPLEYRAPGNGPAPNFSPKGTQVPLAAVDTAFVLPPGAVRPAKVGTIKIGPEEKAWIRVLATADTDHPLDLTRLYLDRNRNGRFDDDGDAVTAVPTQNEKTKAWWTSIRTLELRVPYTPGADPEPYLVNVWMVREVAPDSGATQTPDILRYSVGSWRSGTAKINGVDVLVAAMDGDNNAIFDKRDFWSVLEASAPDAAKTVLSIKEARGTDRLMYVKNGDREQVLEFRSFSQDGKAIEFAVVDRKSTKAADRAADDTLAVERGRPRAATPFAWGHDLSAALADARKSGRRILIDFEATWCGPCKTMDEWIWTDAEVAGLLSAGYAGVKLDGDIEKKLTDKYSVGGYPAMIVLDSTGAELYRFVGYLNSKDAIAFLKR